MTPGHTPPIDVAEPLCAGVMLTHGLILLGPSKVFTISGNYAVMALVMSEDAWGALFLVFGLAWFGAIVSRSIVPRRAGALCGGALILWCAASFVLSFPMTTVGWFLLVVAIGSFVMRVKLR